MRLSLTGLIFGFTCTMVTIQAGWILGLLVFAAMFATFFDGMRFERQQRKERNG